MNPAGESWYRHRVWQHRLTPRGKLVLGTLAVSAFVLVSIVLLVVALRSAMVPEDRAVLDRVFGEQRVLLFWGGVLYVVLVGLGMSRLVQRYVVRPKNLAASTRLIASVNPAHRLEAGGPAELHQLALAVNELADRYQAERADIAGRIAAARADVEAQRSRLAALMSELTVAVLVCSADGRILLYNGAASELLNGPGTVGGPVGLGRSVFAVVDRDLVAFAIDQAAAEDAPGRGTHSATIAWGDALLRARVAVVADPGAPPGTGHPSIGGFVVTLEDLTREATADQHQDTLIRALTADSRAAVANIRAAVESVVDYPDMPVEQQARFLAIVRDEAAALSAKIDAAVAAAPTHLDRRLGLADMLGRDLLDTLARRLQSEGLRVNVDDPHRPLWLVVDPYAVVRAVAHLGRLLHLEHTRRAVELHLGRSGRFARLDIRWAGPPVDSRTLDRWITEPMSAPGSGPAVTVSDVLQGHGGEIWPGEGTHHEYLRILLPLAERPRKGPRVHGVHRPGAPTDVAALGQGTGNGRADHPSDHPADHVGDHPSDHPAGGGGADGDGHGSAPAAVMVDRPTRGAAAYDFTLLEPEGPGAGTDWDSRPLDRIPYTVFDTETTGLFPAQGDEIISIGALRIVNRRLLRQEAYEQLVDPHRTVPEASVKIHGISPELLVGMPSIDEVLPGFADFAVDTVLVGHNVAFDMQFLRARQRTSGVRFEQPVLDTLLLSAVVHPEHESHALDAIAERLGIDVIGRHTALGDAIVTGEIFLRLLELLTQQGITTLGEARAAARATAASRFSESLYTHS